MTATRPLPGAPGRTAAPATGLPAISGHHDALDGLRAVAAFAVLILHVASDTGNTSRNSAVDWLLGGGAMGVPIFFALSGLLLYRPWAAALLLGERHRPRTGTFLRRRALRILPAYWVVVCYVVIVILRPHAGDPRTWLELLTLTYTYDLHPWWHTFLGPIGLGQIWSLTVEAAWYAALPATAAALAWYARRGAARPGDRTKAGPHGVNIGGANGAGAGPDGASGAIGAEIGSDGTSGAGSGPHGTNGTDPRARGAGRAADPGGPDAAETDRRARRLLAGLAAYAAVSLVFTVMVFKVPGMLGTGLFAPRYTIWFAIGMALAVVSVWAHAGSATAGRLCRTVAASWGTCWAIAGVLYCVAASPLSGPSNLSTPDTVWTSELRLVLYGLTALFFMAPVALSPADRPRMHALLGGRVMRFLGRISYSVFLWQMAVSVTWYDHTGHVPFTGHFYLEFPVIAALTIAVSTLTYHLVEKPALRLSRRR